MKKILILPLLLFFLIQGSMAQTPKWVEKAKRAVFSVVTYDKNDKMLNTGNGFFVSEDGLALSDYTLFKGAERAVVITSEGKQMPVSLILGANDMYDVIKFRVAITEKKVPALIVAKTAPAVGADAWMLPYSTQKSIACVTGKVKEVSKVAGEYHYYTLGMQMKDKMVSCPVMNAEPAPGRAARRRNSPRPRPSRPCGLWVVRPRARCWTPPAASTPTRARSFRWASSARRWDASTAPSGPKQPAFCRKYPP